MPLSLHQSEQLASSVADIYEDFQLRIISDMAARASRGSSPAAWQLDKLAEVQPLLSLTRQALAQANGQATQRITSGLLTAYRSGGVDAMADLIPNRGLGLRMADTASRVYPLIREMIAGTIPGTAPILRSVDDAYRSIVSRGVAAQLAGLQTRDTVVRRALTDFAAQGITGYTDSRGRRWNLTSYADMAMRTGVHRAQQQGHADQLQAQGHRLIMVSKHAEECPLCRPWEGRVLALTDDPLPPEDAVHSTGTLDQAKSSGLFHPNCRHRMKAYFPGITRDPPKEQYGGRTYEQAQERKALERNASQWARRRAAATTPLEKAKARAKEQEYRDRAKALPERPMENRNQEYYEAALAKNRKSTTLSLQEQDEARAMTAREAVSEYAWGARRPHAELNGRLRTGQDLDPETRRLRDGLDAAFASTEPLTRTKTLYRAVDGKELRAQLRQTASRGGSFTDKGYLSTSQDIGAAEDFTLNNAVLMHVRARPGTRVLDVDSLADNAEFGQQEFLLPRGTTLHLSNPREVDGVLHIDAEVGAKTVAKQAVRRTLATVTAERNALQKKILKANPSQRPYLEAQMRKLTLEWQKLRRK